MKASRPLGKNVMFYGIAFGAVILGAIFLIVQRQQTSHQKLPVTLETTRNNKDETSSKKAFTQQIQPTQNVPDYTPIVTKTPTFSLDLSAKTQSDATVTVLTKITGVSEGTCKLEISSNAQTYTNSADIIYQPDYSICAGFSVPTAKLGNDNWKILMTVTSHSVVQKKTIDFLPKQ